MGAVVRFKWREADEFGSCPECGNCTDVLKVGKAHWLYCEVHGTKWHAGFSLLPGGLGETAHTWLENAGRLRAYREGGPLPGRGTCDGADRPGAPSES